MLHWDDKNNLWVRDSWFITVRTKGGKMVESFATDFEQSANDYRAKMDSNKYDCEIKRGFRYA